MATVNIDHATVIRIIDNYGFVAVEEIKAKNGETWKKYFTVWTREKVAVGDEVEIQGELTVKLEEYTGSDNVPKQKIAVHVNDAFIGNRSGADAPF